MLNEMKLDALLEQYNEQFHSCWPDKEWNLKNSNPDQQVLDPLAALLNDSGEEGAAEGT